MHKPSKFKILQRKVKFQARNFNGFFRAMAVKASNFESLEKTKFEPKEPLVTEISHQEKKNVEIVSSSQVNLKVDGKKRFKAFWNIYN